MAHIYSTWPPEHWSAIRSYGRSLAIHVDFLFPKYSLNSI